MKESDKKRLQINCRELVGNIVVSDIQDYLYEKDVLTPENLEALSAEKYPQRAVRHLVVYLLPRKGSHAFQAFCEALREANYDYLAERLENTKLDRGGAVDCNDNKCVHERNTLRKKSNDLESELKRVTQKVETIDLRLEQDDEDKRLAIVEGREKDKEKIEQLEYANYKLKKQLSFYEEPGGMSSGGASARTPRSPRKISTENVEEVDSVFHPSINSLDSGLSDMDDIYVNVEDPDEIFINTAAVENDDIDGGETLETVRVPCTPNFSRQEYYDHDESLIEVLTSDIIDCMYNGTESNVCLLRPEYSEYVIALRKSVNKMARKHDAMFIQIGRQVELNSTWREINEQMGQLLNKLLTAEFHNDALTWGKILALFTVTGYVAKRCAAKHKVALPLGEFLAKYIQKKLGKKIEKLGGWDSFCSHLESGEISFTCMFPASLVQSTVTSTKQQRATEKSRAGNHSLGKTAPGRLLDRRDVSGSNTLFKKTW